MKPTIHRPVNAASNSDEYHLVITSTSSQQDAVSLLAAKSNLSKQIVKQAMLKGAVWLSTSKYTRRLRRAKKQLNQGDKLHFYYNKSVLNKTVSDAILITDKGNYSIWYKPYGMLCQGSKWADHTTINRYVALNLIPQRPAFIVHRLDRAATGLVIIGHSKKMTATLAALFEKRHIEKRYWVIVSGKFPHQALSITSDIDSKPASSHVHLIDYNQQLERSLVEVKIDTGRRHQIRIHLASIGYPVIGDRQHGTAKQDDINLQLTACYLGFRCPITDETIELELPHHLKPHLA